jgi:protein-disulfide isomerase
MAGMKGVYMIVGGIVLLGGGAFWWNANQAGAAFPDGPISSADIDAARSFPGYVEGSPDAPVEIAEFADFQCPACKQFWVLTEQDVKQRLVSTGQVRFVFHDFPLDGHPHSRAAHHAAACSDEQGKFWQMHDALFLHQGEWGVNPNSPLGAFRGFAKDIGLNLEEYDACMREGRYRARIQASSEKGIELGVTSTPTLFIGGQRYNGMPYDQLKAIVDSVMATAETQ